MYKNQVCFTTDLHHIYLKPHDVETKDWYTGSYQMSQMDIEEILKEWPEEWRNPTDNNSDSEEVTGKQTEKGKQKQGEGKSMKKQLESEKRPASQDDPTSHQKKKRKATREPYEPKLNLEDYKHIVTSVQETLEGSMTAIVTLQHAMQTTVESKIVKLKTLLQSSPQVQTTPSSVGAPREESISEEGQTKFVRLVPKSVILPSSSPIQQSGSIEVNLAAIPIETLQVVQIQVQEELHVREETTYRKNRKLLKDTKELCRSVEEEKHQLVKEKYNATELEKMINDVCVKFPHCNIPADAALPQKVRIIVSKAKDLEETIEKMDGENKAHIAKLKAKTPGTPLTEKKISGTSAKRLCKHSCKPHRGGPEINKCCR